MADLVYDEVPVVDSEWDESAMPGVPTPVKAILRWEQVPLDARWLPNGPARPNPEYQAGYRAMGWPTPANRLELLVGYRRRNWITHETLLQHLLDCEVYLPAEYATAEGQGNGVVVPVAGSPEKLRLLHSGVVRTQLKVWRRTAHPNSFVVLQAGTKDFDWKITSRDLFDTPELDGPEIEPTELVLPELEPGVDCGELSRVASIARKEGRGFSVAEARAFGHAARLWSANLPHRQAGRPETWPEDLRSAGLIERYAADGTVRPKPWNFGKFGERRPITHLSSFAVSGVYVGFALGEAVGLLADAGRHPDGAELRTGALTHRMLAQSVKMIRDHYDGALPKPPSADGQPSWLTAVLGSEPPPLTWLADLLCSAVPGVGMSAGRAGGLAWDSYVAARAVCEPHGNRVLGESLHDLVTVLNPMVKEPVGLPVHFVLSTLAGDDFPLAQTILDLRADRGADDEDQLNSLGDGYSPASVVSRALLVAAKHDYDPTTALLTSVTHSGHRPLTAAITGAILGARYGTSGLPRAWVTALDHVGALENMAEDMYLNFTQHGVWREGQGERERWRQRYWPNADPIER